MRRSFSVLASLGTLRRYLQNETSRSVTAKSGLLFGASAATLGGSAVVFTSTKPCAFASTVKTESQHQQQWSGTVPPYGLPPIALYQYEVCPFCCKVRAFLDYHQIPYQVIEVNPVSKGELKWSTYKKVPVMKLGDAQVNDSNTIISTLAEELKTSSKKDSTFSQWNGSDRPPLAADGSEAETKWRQWVDDRFVRILTANIYRSLNESWETFEYIAEHGNFGMASRYATRLFGTATMYVIGRRMPAKYDIEGDLRNALYSAVEEWMTAVGSKDFLGGRKPNLADLAVYGVIEAVHGTRTYQDMMKNTKVGDWHERMTSVVGTSSRLNLLSPTTKPTQSHLET